MLDLHTIFESATGLSLGRHICMQDFSAASASAQVAPRERRMRRVERDDGGQARRRYGGGHPFRRVRAGVTAGRTTSRSTLFSVAHPGEGGTTLIGHYISDERRVGKECIS